MPILTSFTDRTSRIVPRLSAETILVLAGSAVLKTFVKHGHAYLAPFYLMQCFFSPSARPSLPALVPRRLSPAAPAAHACVAPARLTRRHPHATNLFARTDQKGFGTFNAVRPLLGPGAQSPPPAAPTTSSNTGGPRSPPAAHRYPPLAAACLVIVVSIR
ncbi:hypothetical protein GGX14DRAFT_575815 [Mycena pura]|uniref:Uncharacterized protein n=1 Tax=Mycena pura TaxID=153505 RepID=A0AAD6UUG1_9AGAR|nr:hypothetical protein GGX14DRAFT_575815 [Mycena pura]